MNAWDSVQDTLDWIEENLAEEIDIAGLSEMAHLSHFYYQRLFTRLVGKPVMEYVKLRRLVAAADFLSSNQAGILDTALQFGFRNHETFTRAFKDTYGLTPEEFRESPRMLSHFLFPQLSLKYHLVDENVPLIVNGMFLEVRTTPVERRRFFSGFKMQSPMGDDPGIDTLGELWNTFHTQKSSIPDMLPKGNEIGVSLPGEIKGHFTYFAGAETRTAQSQDNSTVWIMPEGQYAVCSFEAENFRLLTTDALNKARDYMLGTWLPGHGLKIEPFMAELYYDTSPDATGMDIWFKTTSAPDPSSA